MPPIVLQVSAIVSGHKLSARIVRTSGRTASSPEGQQDNNPALGGSRISGTTAHGWRWTPNLYEKGLQNKPTTKSLSVHGAKVPPTRHSKLKEPFITLKMGLEGLSDLEVPLLLLALLALGCNLRGNVLGCLALVRWTAQAETQGK